MTRELAAIIATPLSNIFDRPWQAREVSEKKADVTSIFKKCKNEDPGNYRPVSLTSVSGKVIKQIILKAISKHMKDKKVIGCSQHGFMEGEACLTKPIAFYSEITSLVDEERTVDVFYLDFSKDMTWMMGQSAPSAILQIIQS